jgi:hypothetical protein
MVLKADNPQELPAKLGVVVRIADNNQLARVDMNATPTINPPQYKVYTTGLIKEAKIGDVVAIVKE